MIVYAQAEAEKAQRQYKGLRLVLVANILPLVNALFIYYGRFLAESNDVLSLIVLMSERFFIIEF